MIYVGFKISSLVFQSRTKTEKHCARYIEDKLIADSTDKLKNDRQFGI